LQHPRLIHTATVTWRFQKNGKNGKKKHSFMHSTTQFSAQSPHSFASLSAGWISSCLRCILL
jgi:hypothetical protein